MTAMPQQGPSDIKLPMTESAMKALQVQRSELKDQARSLIGRRSVLDEQARVLGPEASADHRARIREIDARSADVDRQLMRLDITIARGLSQPLVPDLTADVDAAAAKALAEAQNAFATLPPPPPATFQSPADRLELVATTGVLLILTATVVWLGVKRFFAKPNPQSLEGQARRLDQLQQSIDVIALEMERMSEGQRFVAKVLNEKFPALGAGEAQPVGAKEKEAVKR